MNLEYLWYTFTSSIGSGWLAYLVLVVFLAQKNVRGPVKGTPSWMSHLLFALRLEDFAPFTIVFALSACHSHASFLSNLQLLEVPRLQALLVSYWYGLPVQKSMLSLEIVVL